MTFFYIKSHWFDYCLLRISEKEALCVSKVIFRTLYWSYFSLLILLCNKIIFLFMLSVWETSASNLEGNADLMLLITDILISYLAICFWLLISKSFAVNVYLIPAPMTTSSSSLTVRNIGLPSGPSAASNIPFETIPPIFLGSRFVQTTTTLPTNSSGL